MLTDREMLEELVDMGICPEEVLDVIVSIYGLNRETYENILYYYTGYRTREQMLGEKFYDDDQIAMF